MRANMLIALNSWYYEQINNNGAKMYLFKMLSTIIIIIGLLGFKLQGVIKLFSKLYIT